MALHDLTERQRPGFQLSTFALGAAIGAAAYAVAWGAVALKGVPEVWYSILACGLLTGGICGIVESSMKNGAGTGFWAIGAAVAGAMLGVFLLISLSPDAAVAHVRNGLAVDAGVLPIPVEAIKRELADGPEVFGKYLVAGCFVFLAGSLFGSPGMLLLIVLLTMGWASHTALHVRDHVGLIDGLKAGLRRGGTCASFWLPSAAGLACLGVAGREGTRRFLGSRDGDSSLRGPGRALWIGVALIVAAGAIDLFGAGMLKDLLGG